MPSDECIKVGVLLNGKQINRYAATALQQMVDQTTAEISLLVINSQMVSEDDQDAAESYVKDSERGAVMEKARLWSVVRVKRSLSQPEYAQEVDIDTLDFLADARRIQAEPVPADGLGNELPDSVVTEIVSSSDVVIRFGFGIIKGKILTCPEYDMLSFHHADIRKYRGRAGGFWTFINDDDRAGVTLQQLTESLDGGKIAVYESIDIREIRTLSELRKRIFAVSEGMLVTTTERTENETFVPESPEPLGKVYTERELMDIVTFFDRGESPDVA